MLTREMASRYFPPPKKYGNFMDRYGQFGSPMVKNNIGLLGEMTNGMMAERVNCWASSPTVYAVIPEGAVIAETRVIALGKSKSSPRRGSYPGNPSPW